MKIVIPTIGISNRGGDRVLIELANHLAVDGHQVNYLFPKGTNKTSFRIHEGVKLIEFGIQIKQIEDFSSIFRLFFLFFSIPKSDIIIANYYLTSYPILINKLLRPKTKFFYLVQHYEPLAFGLAEKTYPNLKRWLAEKTYQLGFIHISVAKWIKNRIEKLSRKPSYIFSPGINHEAFFPTQNSKKKTRDTLLIFPGNDKWKGWEDFLKALPFIIKEFPYIDIIASSKEKFPTCHPNIRSVQPSNDDELAELYRAATIYVHPAWWEGCPLAPLEAMACGTPVLAARSEGILEYAEHLQNCYLVNVNDPVDLANGIIHLLKDIDLREKFSKNGLVTAGFYTWDRMYETIKEILFGK